MKRNYHLQSRTSEKRHYFGIRRLKVGVASVVIASGFLFGGAQLAKADETKATTSPATEAVSAANSEALPKPAGEAKAEEVDSSAKKKVQNREAQGKLLLAEAVPSQSPENTEVQESKGASAAPEAAGQEATEAAVSSEKDKQEVVSQPLASEASAKATIEEGHIRFHFKTLPSQNLDSLGLWTWDDVETPSSQREAGRLERPALQQPKR